MSTKFAIIWREEWRRPYESIWSFIEKIKIANIVDGNELLQCIDPMYVKGNSKARRNVNKLSAQACLNLEELTGVDITRIMESMTKLLKFNFLRDPMYIFHTHLRYCRSCVQYNYHSYLHQYKLIQECPFHSEALEECCPNCEKQIYFYNIAVSVPYTCRCGIQIYQSGQHPVWNNWSEFNLRIENKKIIDILNVAVNELTATCCL